MGREPAPCQILKIVHGHVELGVEEDRRSSRSLVAQPVPDGAIPVPRSRTCLLVHGWVPPEMKMLRDDVPGCVGVRDHRRYGVAQYHDALRTGE
jgi:hypothetical protein